jgi:hypothetical protein
MNVPIRRANSRWTRARFFGAAVLFLGPSVSSAHDTWILPNRPAVPAGQAIQLEATSGMAFPKLETAIAPERIGVARIRVGGRIESIRQLRSGKGALRLSVVPGGPGLATLWLESKPKAIDLKPEEVHEYLEEIGARESIEKEWKSGTSARWRETYVKHAKTFVRVGEPSDVDKSWSEPVGMRLEIVPESDPSQWTVGSSFSVTVLKEGRPVQGIALGFVEAGKTASTLRKTDARGSVSFTPTTSGCALLRVTDLRSSGTPGDWESDFSTLTAWIANR